MSPAEARLKQVPSGMTDAEWNQRVNLAACYRLVALYGWDNLVDTHISARVPGPDHHFLINPYGLMFEEITASSLVKVDLHGNQLSESEYSINPAGFTIHSAIHEVREDAGCVLHLHTPDGTAVASCKEGLLPMNQTAQFVTHDLAYHDYEGVALDHDERPRLQKDLGNKNHMLLRNHGTLTVGRSVASAFERMYHLERACTMQVRTRMLGPTAYPVEQAVIDKNEKLFANPDRAELRSTNLVWPPLLRKLDRIVRPAVAAQRDDPPAPLRIHPFQPHRRHGSQRRQLFMLDYWGLALKQASDGLREELVERQESPPQGRKWKVAVCGPQRPAQVALGPDFTIGWDSQSADFAMTLGEFYCKGLTAPVMVEIKRDDVVFARVYDIRGRGISTLLAIPAP